MSRKTTLGLALLLVIAVGSLAYAHGLGNRSGQTGSVSHMADNNCLNRIIKSPACPASGAGYDEETVRLGSELYNLEQDLRTVLNAPEPDAAKTRKLQTQISKLEVSLNEKLLNQELERRKNNS